MKALVCSTFRSIKKTFSRFLAIFAIIAIGSGFFAGIKSAAPDMKKGAWDYYNASKLNDIHILSTLGFEEEELDSIRELNGDYYTKGGYSADLYITGDSVNRKIAKVYSYSPDSEMNIPELIDGRLPENPSECVVDCAFHSSATPEIGEKIYFEAAGEEDISDTLNRTEYTVVGHVRSPMYIAFDRGTTSVGNGSINGYVLVPEENFCLDVYTDVYVRINGAEKFDPFTDTYTDLVDNHIEALEALGEAQIEKRVRKITDEAYEEINDAKAEVSDARKDIEEAKEKLTDGEIEYNDGLRSVDNLNSVIAQLEQVLADYKTDAVKSEDEVTNTISTLNQGDFFAADETLEQLLTGYMTIPAAYDNGTKAACKQGIEQYISGIEESVAKIEDSLAEARSELDDGYAEIEDGENEIAEALEDIAEAEKEVADRTEDAQWYVLSRDGSCPGYSNYGDDCDKVDAIAKVFPVFFIMVSVLVCWTTMTRMVEEQRTQIGTLKALGYSNFSIMFQYVLYAAASSIPGALFGLVVGFRLFPVIIFKCYNTMYAFDSIETPFKWDYALGCIVVSCLCTGLSSLYACRMELFSRPAQLMRAKPPKNGKRILLEKVTFIWKRLKFTYKVTFRNLFRYKSRVVMTIIGVGGCTALLLTAFGLRHSIVSIVDRQYEDIFVYDAIVAVDEDKADYDEIRRTAENTGVAEDMLFAVQRSADVYSKTESAEIYLVAVNDGEELSKFIDMHDRTSKEKLELSGSGVVINEKLARLLDIKKGESIYFNSGHELKVDGIMENYTYNYVFMTKECYNGAGFDTPADDNIMYINMSDPSQEDSFAEALISRDDVLAVSYASGGTDKFRELVGSLSVIVVVIIIFAGALAFVVMFNLTNINVNERMHELATIKVLGFFDGEVASYIYRENTISALMGTAVGLVAGIFFEKFVIRACEVDIVMFAPDIPAYCFWAAGGITVLFAVIVNILLYFRLKKINMAESLKAVE